ncbi:T9SS type A sorting domain-containing protein [Flaviramulus sp. BrNp1-15]|uniref:T9SS type A sorting domain-containing protein n=1 Tax=Flaviramulus sp. BrNp1-15 TaxID=2916754 RepID=UPI001EE816AC|nr:T9SS type A sorting domain-containing protein [Flaviramulus sp. BrNp1-15]ULC58057.1 T9SS type A sorting domain-containing protein [Flaviramulus sp. BrNp1-15]
MIKKYLIRFSLIFFNIICYSQIVNEGIFQISPLTDVYFENEYTNKSTGVHNNNGDLYLNNNFINDGITTSISGTTYFKSSINPLITISGVSNEINLYNLEIDITAASSQGVSIADNFALNIANAINFISGDIRLVGESQLIQTHTGTNVNTVSSGKILVDQQGTVSPYKFNYWSSPVNNGGTFSLFGGKFDGTDSNINSFTPQQTLFNTGAPYNGVPSTVDGGSNVTTALTINSDWLYKYTRGNGSNSGWIKINQNSLLNPGEGYTMKGSNSISANQNYVFYGAPNNGEYLHAISNGEQSLLGNPYPSAIDISKFITDNVLVVDAVHYWVDGGSTSHMLSDYLGGYAIRNLTGGVIPSVTSSLISGIGSSGSVTSPTQYMSVGQGFFVEAIGTGNIVFNNSQRIFKTDTSGEANFYKQSNSKASGPTNQYIRLGHEDPEGFHRQLLLGFLPNSTAGIDYNQGYDAAMTDARDDDMFFIIENDLSKKYAIQGVNSFIDSMEFPLGILISEQGNHRIMLDMVEDFSNAVYLKDNYLNTTHNLSETSYDLVLPIGEYLDRFSIVFLPQNALSINDNSIEPIKIFYDGLEHIVVNNNEKIELKNIEIFNVLGQEVLKLNKNINNTSKIVIPFNNSDGIYFVKVETINSKKTQKILKY